LADEAGKDHITFAVDFDADGTPRVGVDEHDEGECEGSVERARHHALGHETVYEAPGAKSTVGYSRAYAEKFDSVFGKN
jgi:hypothetical protein